MTSKVLSSSLSTEPSSSTDYTQYRQKLADVRVLNKDEIAKLRTFDAEQIRFENSLKDSKVNPGCKLRSSSCTYSVDHAESSNCRRYSVPRNVNAAGMKDDSCSTTSLQDSIDVNEEPSISGVFGSADRDVGDQTFHKSVEDFDASLSSDFNKIFKKHFKSAEACYKVAPNSLRRSLGLRLDTAVPVSGRRLSIPKRSYSPEPLKKSRLNFGSRKTIEVICLSDLKEKIAALETQEFSLPEEFITLCKKRLSSSTSETALSGGIQKEEALVLAEKPDVVPEASIVPKFVDCALSEAQFLTNSLSPETEKISRSSAAVKRKRGRPRKCFNTSSVSELDTSVLNSSEEAHLPEKVNSDVGKISTRSPGKGKVSPCDVSFGRPRKPRPDTEERGSKASLDRTGNNYNEADDVNFRIANNGNNKVTSIENTCLNKGNVMHRGPKSSFASNLPTRNNDLALEVSDSKGVDAIVRDVLEEIISKLCGPETKNMSSSCGLIMEPLRRPQERRRVPPLRIRLPKHREIRKRVPARSRDYSPPGRTSRPKFSRILAVAQKHVSKDAESPGIKSSRRSSRLAKTSTVSEGQIDIITDAMVKEHIETSLSKKRKFSLPSCIPTSEGPLDEAAGSTDDPLICESLKLEVKDSQPEVFANVQSPVAVKSHPCGSVAQITSASVLESFDEVISDRLKDEEFITEVGELAAVLSQEHSQQASEMAVSKQISLTPESQIAAINKDVLFAISQMSSPNKFVPTSATPLLSTANKSSGRPARYKKSYQELYPTLFKNKRKRSENALLRVRKSSSASGIKAEKQTGGTSSSEILRHETFSVDKKISSTQNREMKSSRHPFDVDESGRKESTNGESEGFGRILRSGSITNEKAKDKKRRTSEGSLLSPKNSVLSNTHLEIDTNCGDSVRITSSSVSPHWSALKSEEADSLKKCNDLSTEESNVDFASLRKLSKRGKKPSGIVTKAVADEDAQKRTEFIHVGDAETSAPRRKSKRGSQATTLFSSERLSPKKSSMPYFKRIAQRRKLNPLAIGLKSRSEDTDRTIFYRELLLRGKELRRAETEEDLNVDIFAVPVNDDEFGFHNPATDVASAVDRILPRKTFCDEDGESTGITAEMILNNVAEESFERKELLGDMLFVILAQYTAEITASGIHGGESVEYGAVVTNARRLRDKVFTFSEGRRINAQWAHKLLLEQLPLPILATYINLLRYCKSSARFLVDILMKEQPNNDSLNAANRLIMSFMNCKVLDPQTAAIAKTLGKRRLESVCLLAVDPYFAHLDYTPRIKAHEYIFKVLFPSSFGRVEQLRPCLPSSVDFSAAEIVEYLIDIVGKRVVELTRKYPSKKIVLAGWGTSCYINHEVVQSVPNIHAILDFAFPLKTVEGMRGDVDDTLLLTYCPSLFIVGEQALDCDITEIQKVASRMKAFSGVIIVGAANSNLQISPLRFSLERFTQKTVHRALIDDVIDFLERHCLQSSKSLKPQLIAETSNADLSVMKGSTTSSRYIPKSRRQSDAILFSDSSKKRIPLPENRESDSVFKRPQMSDFLQNEQTLLITEGSSLPSGGTAQNDSFRKQGTASLESVIVKSLADETVDSLMAPL